HAALGGAVRPDDGPELAGRHREVDVVERGEPAEADRQPLGGENRAGVDAAPAAVGGRGALTVGVVGRHAGKLGGGLCPPSEASPQDAVRAAGRRGAGDPPSEASNPEIRAAGRRGAGDPPSEASNPEIRAAGRRGAGDPASEASNPEIRAAGRRGRRASRSTAGGWAPRVRGERPDNAPPSEASHPEPRRQSRRSKLDDLAWGAGPLSSLYWARPKSPAGFTSSTSALLPK